MDRHTADPQRRTSFSSPCPASRRPCRVYPSCPSGGASSLPPLLLPCSPCIEREKRRIDVITFQTNEHASSNWWLVCGHVHVERAPVDCAAVDVSLHRLELASHALHRIPNPQTHLLLHTNCTGDKSPRRASTASNIEQHKQQTSRPQGHNAHTHAPFHGGLLDAAPVLHVGDDGQADDAAHHRQDDIPRGRAHVVPAIHVPTHTRSPTQVSGFQFQPIHQSQRANTSQQAAHDTGNTYVSQM
jgi:hypothetical protein